MTEEGKGTDPNRAEVAKVAERVTFLHTLEKKDGSLRLCVDYRELNRRIKQDSYPLPIVEAILQSLAGKKFFSTHDLCSGYRKIPLAETARRKLLHNAGRAFQSK
ncbi:hypothetical protein OSTOST_10892 [Ostertagia ostertagi]